MNSENSNVINRRRTLALAAGASVAGLVSYGAERANAQSVANGYVALPRNACIITTNEIDDWFYLDANLQRADITEGVSGIPCRLSLQLLDTACRPLTGARVDIWQADAQGIYSGFAQQGDDAKVDTRGKTFLRGTQLTNDTGSVQFITVYPGWHRGRTAHIYVKVYQDQTAVFATQLYLPDAINEFIYSKVPEYQRSATRDTLNFNDHFVTRSQGHACLEIKERPDCYDLSLVMGVDRSRIAKQIARNSTAKLAATPALRPAERIKHLLPPI